MTQEQSIIRCANCKQTPRSGMKLMVCRVCQQYGRHKLPQYFPCHFCSINCYLSKKSTHLLLHSRLENFEQLLQT
ncbi:hypothetical protein RB195_017150 [Necator americanus]|uniref:Uncharacterized protein n=2 Tax=Necator americanus TaxID=51031 RepID=W2SWR4_NECAM|nr:hypothetical protein NECAME_04169 [Necator americanus]ETN73948.1 hypothetical protein NECAME_04169 [Necator americanus]